MLQRYREPKQTAIRSAHTPGPVQNVGLSYSGSCCRTDHPQDSTGQPITAVRNGKKTIFLTTRIENNQLRQHKHGLEQFRQGISGSSKLRIYPFKVRQTVRFYVDTVICRRTKASARRRALYARQGDPNVTVQGRHTQSITRVGAS